MPRALDVDCGLRLRVWDHQGDGPPVLFLHGYLDTGRSFDAVAEKLAGEARCLCLDWRGHGQSEWAPPGASYHLLDHLKDLALLLSRLDGQGLAPAALVAHSMGGNIALLLVGSWPERVGRLLLLDCVGPPAENPKEQPRRLGRLLRELEEVKPFPSFARWKDGVGRLRATNPGLSEEGAQQMARHLLVPDPEAADGFGFALDPRLKGPTPVRYPEEMWLALFGRIRAKVRILRAGDGIVPLGEPAKGRIARLADGALETLPGAPHHLHVERSGEVAAAVRALLAS